MDGVMRCISFFGYYQRKVTLIVASSWIFFSVPLVGICSENSEFLNQIEINNLDAVIK